MKTAIVYYSKHHGNTKKLLDAIAEKHDVTLIDVVANKDADVSEYDRIGLASGIYFSAFAKQITAFTEEKLRETILLLIEAFFAANPDILLYICETGDGRQAFRSRLFVRWFNTYSNRDAYIMQTAEVQEGKTKNFAALIVQKSNPRLKEILAEFDETIRILTNKPQCHNFSRCALNSKKGIKLPQLPLPFPPKRP